MLPARSSLAGVFFSYNQLVSNLLRSELGVLVPQQVMSRKPESSLT